MKKLTKTQKEALKKVKKDAKRSKQYKKENKSPEMLQLYLTLYTTGINAITKEIPKLKEQGKTKEEIDTFVDTEIKDLFTKITKDFTSKDLRNFNRRINYLLTVEDLPETEKKLRNLIIKDMETKENQLEELRDDRNLLATMILILSALGTLTTFVVCNQMDQIDELKAAIKELKE